MSSFLNFFKTKKRANKCLVLMYHHIAALPSDVWDIAVSPANFEQHLQVLEKTGQVIGLEDMVDLLKNDLLTTDRIAITFDDGYLDNLDKAVPLLKKYNLPATFFITSKQNEDGYFWWDELENTFLFAEELPQSFEMIIENELVKMDLKSEARLTQQINAIHKKWNACEQAPPTKRAQLFYSIWEKLKPLTENTQQKYLQKIREWAGMPPDFNSAYHVMSAQQVKSLANDKLFTVGAHTETHIALGFQDYDTQKKEIAANAIYLKNITGKDIDLLAYPYGNYNRDTIVIAAECELKAAFTTEEKPVLNADAPYHSGRLKVANISGNAFKNQLKLWLSQ